MPTHVKIVVDEQQRPCIEIDGHALPNAALVGYRFVHTADDHQPRLAIELRPDSIEIEAADVDVDTKDLGELALTHTVLRTTLADTLRIGRRSSDLPRTITVDVDALAEAYMALPRDTRWRLLRDLGLATAEECARAQHEQGPNFYLDRHAFRRAAAADRIDALDAAIMRELAHVEPPVADEVRET
jgi:hypothetical protein